MLAVRANRDIDVSFDFDIEGRSAGPAGSGGQVRHRDRTAMQIGLEARDAALLLKLDDGPAART